MKSLYYPQSCIHIALITEVQDTGKPDFSFVIKTERKSYFLQADTELLKNEWIKAINLALFHNKNYGDDVRVCLLFTYPSDCTALRENRNNRFD
jgi:hypothetical protein